MNANIDFINEKTGKALFRMFVPMMIGMVLNLAYNLVDTLWIGNMLGDTALAALTNATPIVQLLYSFGMGISNGMGIILAGKVAEGKRDEQSGIISSTLLYTLVASIVLVAIMELLLHPILRLMNTQPETYDFAYSYLAIYMVGIIPSFLFTHLTSMLKCYGDTMFQMISLLISSILNAVLDPLFIRLIGFSGAAIATFISQFVSLILVVWYCRRRNYFSTNLKSITAKYLSQTVKMSLPTVVQQCTPTISSAVITTCVNAFGIVAMAGYGVLNKLDMLLFFPATVMNMVLTPIVGFCIGGKRRDRADEYVKFGLRVTLILVAFFGALLLLFSTPVTRMFGCSDEAIAIVSHALKLLVIGYLFNAVTQCFMGFINGIGNPKSGMVITILNHVVIRIPFSIILTRMSLGLDGVWITLLFSFIVAFICSLIIIRKAHKEINS